ncbi:hypothetical protein PGT21_019251 [Puccinia graminis f. sp. tritici]|uniref:Uncharacterized protein n=1 Tax=Puccinia graminis f. sp. tritici TaxID=56615 RepID=A0A5B0P1Z5_PUCGR|nr:hypothetical protein PGTUg99_029898 [Puccinia graminis f. sp. tritici]KAA1099748.1 hypothetical protein PGT21_019251 [Puccinia graminis f. sp. tritici]
MALHQVVLVLVMSSLYLQSSLQQTKPQSLKDIECGQVKEFEAGDCPSAYRKIIYDPDSTLDQTERSVERTSGSCVTRIDNPKFMNVPKGIIEDAFDQIGAKCNGRAGNVTLPGFDGVSLLTRRHTKPGASSYEDDVETNRVFCYNNPKLAKTVKEDCIEAYRLIPTNAEGRLVSIDHHEPKSEIYSSGKKCVVSISTTGGSKVIALKSDIDILFQKVIQECGSRWGFIVTTKGAQGRNGKVTLLVWGRA